jgi:hypothetical protein
MRQDEVDQLEDIRLAHDNVAHLDLGAPARAREDLLR